jgi:hypothetical protein
LTRRSLRGPPRSGLVQRPLSYTVVSCHVVLCFSPARYSERMAARNKNKGAGGKTDPQRVIGYVRVSSDDQRLGPDAQRVALEQWCAAHGGQLVLTCTDRRVSGGAALDQRPGLLAALAALKRHNAAILLVARRDRLARDVLVAALVERLTERDGAEAQAADGPPEGVRICRSCRRGRSLRLWPRCALRVCGSSPLTSGQFAWADEAPCGDSPHQEGGRRSASDLHGPCAR